LQTLSLHSASEESSEHLVFMHANGFPPGTYASLLDALMPLGRISTVEHRPLWQEKAPTFLSWEVYADDAIATLRLGLRSCLVGGTLDGWSNQLTHCP